MFVWSMYSRSRQTGTRVTAARRFDNWPHASRRSQTSWGCRDGRIEWYVEQARTHRVDGVVHLVAHDSRSSWFTTTRSRKPGSRLLEIDADNADARTWDEASFVAAFERFIQERL